MTSDKKAIILLSGGLDSATCLAIARAQGFACHALSFRYGQRHLHELDCARQLAQSLGAASHRIIDIDLRQFGHSALTDQIDVPKHRSTDEMSKAEIPITYVPARNTIFLAFALAHAETLPAQDIFIGVNALDYSGYPDCRPQFIAAFETLANLATKAGVEGHKLTLHAPLLHLTKAQIIEKGLALGVNYAQTSSCYDPKPNGSACGSCDACLLRTEGFDKLGKKDPAFRGE
jgi:7-cyano-7-deazaguanine synthase